jgi:hypothetical protein
MVNREWKKRCTRHGGAAHLEGGRSVFILVAVAVCLMTAGGLSPTKINILDSGKAGRNLLADRIETRDSITYTTDPKMEQHRKKDEREEKEKENNSWKMLQNMYWTGHGGRPPSSSQPSGN